MRGKEQKGNLLNKIWGRGAEGPADIRMFAPVSNIQIEIPCSLTNTNAHRTSNKSFVIADQIIHISPR